jgi:hypothetical protein
MNACGICMHQRIVRHTLLPCLAGPCAIVLTGKSVDVFETRGFAGVAHGQNENPHRNFFVYGTGVRQFTASPVGVIFAARRFVLPLTGVDRASAPAWLCPMRSSRCWSVSRLDADRL